MLILLLFVAVAMNLMVGEQFQPAPTVSRLFPHQTKVHHHPTPTFPVALSKNRVKAVEIVAAVDNVDVVAIVRFVVVVVVVVEVMAPFPDVEYC